MIEHLKTLNDLDMKLGKLTANDLNQLYLRVFTSVDGELILQDLANRLFAYAPAGNDFQEGQRSVYVSIISRLRDAVSPKQEE